MRDRVVQDRELRTRYRLQIAIIDNQCAIDFVIVDIRHRFPEVENIQSALFLLVI